MTVEGPDRVTVIGSLSAIVAVALPADASSVTWDDRLEVMEPSVTVKLSDVSESKSLAMAIVIVRVDDPAGKVTVPDSGE